MTPLILLLTGTAAADDHVLTILITNPADVARREKGAVAVAVADVFLDINKKTQKVIADRMTTVLAEHGVAVDIATERVNFPNATLTRFYFWDGTHSQLLPVGLTPGPYLVLRVDVKNADEVLAARTNSHLAWLARQVGIDPDAVITDQLAPIVLTELEAAGATALLGR